MNSISDNFEQFLSDIKQITQYFKSNYNSNNSPVKIYTHLDADGLSSGAILGKALYREKIPFQITVIKQLEQEEIKKIVVQTEEFGNFVVFSDPISGPINSLIELYLPTKISVSEHKYTFVGLLTRDRTCDKTNSGPVT